MGLYEVLLVHPWGAIKAELDSGLYPTGIKVSDEEFSSINLVRHSFHGEWNYSIRPRGS
jgi:hypothetical protein